MLSSGAYCVERLSDIDARYLDRVYRRFHNLPWEIAETPRMRIREITVEDVPQLYELYRDASITAFMDRCLRPGAGDRLHKRIILKMCTVLRIWHVGA